MMSTFTAFGRVLENLLVNRSWNLACGCYCLGDAFRWKIITSDAIFKKQSLRLIGEILNEQ